MDYKLFISHSHKDEKAAKALIDLLITAIPLAPDEVLCTSVRGYKLNAGVNIHDRLREIIHQVDVFIALISKESIHSFYSLFEQGARWGSNKEIIPLITVPMKDQPSFTEYIKDSPFKDTHFIHSNQEGLRSLIVTVRAKLKSTDTNISEDVYEERLKDFVIKAEKKKNHNLSEVPSVFIPRDKVIERILNKLNSDSRIINIYSTMHRGKTSIALKIGHMCLPGNMEADKIWFDYVAFVDVKGKKRKILINDIISTISSVIGHENIAAEADLEKKKTALLDKLQEIKTLVILDDLEEFNVELFEWIDKLSPRHKFIITTEKGLLGHMQVQVEDFSLIEAVEFVKSIARRNDLLSILEWDNEKLEKMVESIGRHPFLLEKAVILQERGTFFYGNQQGFTFSEIVEKLHQDYWEMLTPSSQKLLLVFGLYPTINFASRQALRSISGLSPSDFDDSLGELLDWHLIEKDSQVSGKLVHFMEEEGWRFLIPVETKTFASNKLNSSSVKDELINNWSVFNNRVINKLSRSNPNVLYWNSLVSPQMDEVDTEWAGINDFLKYLYKIGKKKEFLDLIMVSVHYMHSRSYNQERIDFVKKSIVIAHDLGLKYYEAILKVDALAWSYIEENDFDAAAAEIESGIMLITSFSDQTKKDELNALAQTWLARIKIESNKVDEARERIESAKKYKVESWIKSRVCMVAGDIDFIEGNFFNAKSNYNETFSLMQDYDFEGDSYQIKPRLAFAHLALGENPAAEKKFKEMIQTESIAMSKLYGNYGLSLLEIVETKSSVSRKYLESIKNEMSKLRNSNLLLHLTEMLEDKLLINKYE